MNKLKFKKGEIVSATKTFNGEIITGEFQGYRLYNDEIPDAVVGVVHVSGDRSYDVDVTSIRHYESEDERIRKEILSYFNSEDIANQYVTEERRKRWTAWLEKQKEQKPVIDYIGPAKAIQHPDGTITQHKFGYLENKENEKTITEVPLMKVYGFEVGDKVRLKDGDGRTHIIKAFEEVEGVHGPNFYHVEFEDNSARDGIYPGEEYPNGYYTNMVKLGEPKPIFRVGDNVIAKDGTCIPKELFHIERIEDGCYWDGNGSILICNQDDFQLISQKPAEWSEEDETIIKGACSALEIHGHTKLASMLKSIRPQPKQGLILTEEQEKKFGHLFSRPSWKPSDEQMNYLCNAVDAAIRKHNESVSGYEPARVLKSLYEDLQKRYGTC